MRHISFGEGNYDTPGWQRAKERHAQGQDFSRTPMLIEGQLIASEVTGGGFEEGERVFHQKFGYGRIVRIDGNKLTIDFEKAGEKRVIDTFVERT